MRKKQNRAVIFKNLPEIGLMTVLGRNITNMFPIHIHQSLTVGLITKGTALLSTYRGTVVVSQGNLFIVNPGEPHSIQPRAQESYDYLIFCFSKRLIKNIYTPIRDENCRTLDIPYIQQHLIENQPLFNQFIYFYKIFGCKLPQNNATPLLKSIFKELITDRADVSPNPNPWIKNTGIKNVQLLIDQNPSSNLSLRELAQIAHLSPYYFLKSFKKEIGISPYHYQLQMRIKNAQNHLLTGHTIAETAQETGFVDQSHFTRFFQKITGITPGEYLKFNLPESTR